MQRNNMIRINKYLLKSLAHEIVLRHGKQFVECVYNEMCFNNNYKYRALHGECY